MDNIIIDIQKTLSEGMFRSLLTPENMNEFLMLSAEGVNSPELNTEILKTLSLKAQKAVSDGIFTDIEDASFGLYSDLPAEYKSKLSPEFIEKMLNMFSGGSVKDSIKNKINSIEWTEEEKKWLAENSLDSLI